MSEGKGIYAGIGSRETPDDVQDLMCGFAFDNTRDLILRSGGALGADKAFERGVAESMAFEADPDTFEYVEIYWPWEGYGDQDWGYVQPRLTEPTEGAMALAEKYHPAWNRMGQGGKKLHARNSHIVLGTDLDDPVDFVVCWTPGGKFKGGTAQALRIALDLGVEIYNLAIEADREKIEGFTHQ